MAHNFRLSATTDGFYVSKAGNDSSAGTANAPLLTLAPLDVIGGSNDRINIIGTGSYHHVNVTQTNRGTLVADGTVKILGDGTTLNAPINQGGSGYKGLYFDQFAGFNFRVQLYTNAVSYRQCTFKVVGTYANAANSYCDDQEAAGLFEDCLFFNVNMSNRGGGRSQNTYRRCLFFHSRIDSALMLDSCYIDSTSSVTATNGTNNNVDPNCDPAGSYGYRVQGGAFALTSPQGISVLPLFNSVAKEDFTLRAASPHILKGIGPAQYRYANSFYVEYTGSVMDAANQGNTHLRGTGTNTVVPLLGITDGTQGFEVNSQSGLTLVATDTSTGFGTFVTGRIPFSDIADEMTVMLMKAGLNYDTSFPALESQFNYNQPEIYNNNVPDYSNYALGNAGRNPARLSYRMRWSTKTNPNADLSNVSDWVTGTTFVEFEWNAKPLWNPATGIGNGEATFDMSIGQAIQCTFYQLQICIRNNYYH